MSFFDIFQPLDAEALKPQPNEGRDLPGRTRTVKQIFERPVFDGIKLRTLLPAKSTTPLIAPDLSMMIH